jgi:Tol biopolymer transport system component
MDRNESRLDTWKQIAEYLKKDARTVIRWERERGLPVHRIPGQKRSTVYAWPSEIDGWLRNGGAERASPDGSAPAPAGPSTDVLVSATPRSRKRRTVWIASAATVAVLAGALWMASNWGKPLPRLGKPVQLTGDGHDKDSLAVSASAIFFTSFSDSADTITRMDLDTRKALTLPFSRHGLEVLDVSRDGSNLLVIDTATNGENYLAWLVPAHGGPARRLGDLYVAAAAWSPGGQTLAYVSARNLYLSKADGTDARKLMPLPHNAQTLCWSPDGSRLRLSLWDEAARASVLTEITIARPALRKLLPDWPSGLQVGRWSADEKFFLFSAIRGGVTDLWAIGEKGVGIGTRGPDPFRLTTSPRGVANPVFSADGKTVFAIWGDPIRSDLMRYDPRAGRFVSYPDQEGLPALQISFSKDGRRAAYVKSPDWSLWTMDADGSNRNALTGHATLPAWSPDGRQIAFMQQNDDNRRPSKIRLISSAGGPVQQPVRQPEWQGGPTWTVDGKALVFGENGERFPIAATCSLHKFDLATGQTSDIPGSTGFWTARTCPTGRYIVALNNKDTELVLYDEILRAWAHLYSLGGRRIGENPSWSADGRYIYFDDPQSTDPAMYRIRISSRRVERVASLKGIQRYEKPGSWTGLSPEGLPMVVRMLGASEIYAWDWNEP